MQGLRKRLDRQVVLSRLYFALRLTIATLVPTPRRTHQHMGNLYRANLRYSGCLKECE